MPTWSRSWASRPDQVVDYKALVGDKSDNIPGVPGVGEKTTQELFKVYKSLDDIYANLEMIPPKVRTKLEAGRDSAYMSRELAAIRTDLPIKIDLTQAKADNFDPANVEKLFRELEFRTLVPELAAFRKNGITPTGKKGAGQMAMFTETAAAPVAPVRQPSSLKVTVVDTDAKLKKLASELKKAEVISFDTETTSTEELEAQLVGISLAVRDGEGWYIPVGHNAGPNLPIEQVIEALRPAMTNPKIPKIGTQRQIRLPGPGEVWIEGGAARIRFDDRRVDHRPVLTKPGSQESGLCASRRGNDSHRGADRERERTSARWRRWMWNLRPLMPLPMRRCASAYARSFTRIWIR